MVAAGIIVSAAGCDKVPLLAPSGTVITLFPVSSTVALNSEVEIVATVIEQGQATAPPTNGNGNGNGTTTPPPNGTTTTPTTGAGTPVHNGTVVSFTTTLGRIDPAEARTQNGQVRVKFISGGQSGTATITAFSGGASGRLENLRVGTAAVERVIVTANPQTLGASGGTAEISARVEDISGLPVVGVAVNFTASAGQVAPNPAVTDPNGVARATLNTTREANLTATVAGKTSEQLTVGLNPRTGVGITPPTNTPAAGQPAIFTVNVSADANIRNVVIDWGDGTSTTLGALSASTTVSHTYLESGTFSVRVTATDASGFTETVATVVTILPSQPPGVTVRASNTNPVVNEDVILTATVTGATSTIIRYEWNFGNGSNSPPITTSGPQATTSWATVGSKTVSVRAVQATGPAGEGFATVVVRAAFAPSAPNKPN
jgi:Bacterial Ig-like domain (group 1)/PKD domain